MSAIDSPRISAASLSLPQGYGSLNVAGGLAAGQQASGSVSQLNGWDYLLPDPASRPRQSIALGRLYLPVVVFVAVAVTAPTKAVVGLRLAVGLEPRWATLLELTLAPSAVAGGPWSVGNATVIDDLTNPVPIGWGEEPALKFDVTLDQTIKFGNSYLFVCSQGPIAAPNPTPFPAPLPGSLAYTLP